MAVEQTPEHIMAVGQALLVYITCLASILWWDVLSTLPREIKLVWKPLLSKKKNSSFFSIGLATVFCFAVARWLTVIQFIGIVWSIWYRAWDKLDCNKFYLWDSILSALVVSAASAIMAVRVSALWGRQRLLDIPLFAAWGTLTGIVIWAATGVEPVPGAPYCVAHQTSSNQLEALYLGAMIFDLIILSLTVASALKHKQNGRVGPLLHHLVKDGIIYFVAVFTCNALAVAFEFQNADPALKPVNASLATIGTSIFISRLFLSMRSAVLNGVEIPTFHTTAVTPNLKSGKFSWGKNSAKSKEARSPAHTEQPPQNRIQDIELSTEVAVDIDEDGRSFNSKARLQNLNETPGLGVQVPTSLPFDGENSVRSESFSSPRLTTVGDSLQFDKNILPNSVRQEER